MVSDEVLLCVAFLVAENRSGLEGVTRPGGWRVNAVLQAEIPAFVRYVGAERLRFQALLAGEDPLVR